MELGNLQDELERKQNFQLLNKSKIKQLKDEIAQVEKLLRTMTSSVDRMRVRPGSPMRQRMKQAMKEHGKTASMVLGLVLNVTYFAVQLGLGI
ncbi:hypothetical protein BFJ68_g17671 [Fusarium oxysporum]|uniref:Uncharacterized protein n=1 Tax=Fusarium oxysporum TaxID=5507 RepID=A0A420NL71_FUSOX|nr:hypothetical protein BFJ68_g17671 [Fusarium oxysporum]